MRYEYFQDIDEMGVEQEIKIPILVENHKEMTL